jgi:hypothetical protein
MKLLVLPIFLIALVVASFAPAYGQYSDGGVFNAIFEVVQKEDDIFGQKAFDIINYKFDFRGLSDIYENFVLVEDNDVSMSNDSIMISGIVNADKKPVGTTTKEITVFEMSGSMPIDKILKNSKTGETKYISEVGNNGELRLNEITFRQPLTELTLTGEEGSQNGTLKMRSYRR